jgi:hypothetical protein
MPLAKSSAAFLMIVESTVKPLQPEKLSYLKDRRWALDDSSLSHNL